MTYSNVIYDVRNILHDMYFKIVHKTNETFKLVLFVSNYYNQTRSDVQLGSTMASMILINF